MMRISVVIVNYRTPDMVLACLKSLDAERGAFPGLKAVVVDNASGDDSVAILTRETGKAPFAEWVRFTPLPHNGGFGWGNNEAILSLLDDDAPPEAILLLNPDAMIEPGAITALAQDMERRPDAGAIGSQLVNQDGSLSGSAFRFPTIAREFIRGAGIGGLGRILGIKPILVPIGEAGEVDWVTGASVLVRTPALREAGMFDTGFFLYFEEVELMHRFGQHGWKCYHCPDSRVVHVAGASTGVVDGRSGAGRAPPDYVFHSRHRYFALTAGRRGPWLADLAWLGGDLLARLVGLFSRRYAAHDNVAERKALLRIGIGAGGKRAHPAITRTGDPAGRPPAWMET